MICDLIKDLYTRHKSWKSSLFHEDEISFIFYYFVKSILYTFVVFSIHIFFAVKIIRVFIKIDGYTENIENLHVIYEWC